MRFVGTIEAKVDAKGRLFLPASFRKILLEAGEELLTLKRDVFQQCLVVYPFSVWNERVDSLRNHLSIWNKEQQMVFRQFVADVEVFSLDGNGRFLVPKRYLRSTGIEQEVTFIGMDNTIELWPRRADDLSFMEEETFGHELEAFMGGGKDE